MTACRDAEPCCAYRSRRQRFGLDDGTLALGPASAVGTLGANTAQAAPATVTASCAYVDPVSRGIVIAPSSAFERLRSGAGSASVSAAEALESFAWHDGSRTAALRQTITLGNDSVRLTRPADDVLSAKNLPTPDQLAAALRAVPPAQRRTNTGIVLSPVPHPNSTARRTVAADAGGGAITFYPMSRAQTQRDVDLRLMHETGHNYQGTLWRSADDVAVWTNVIARDGNSPSPYAGANTGEDFCEFLVIYDTSRGTACEGAARRLYPNRWAQMARYERGMDTTASGH